MSHDPYLAVRYRDYRLLLAGNLVANVGSQMVALAVGWELYQRTNSAPRGGGTTGPWPGQMVSCGYVVSSCRDFI